MLSLLLPAVLLLNGLAVPSLAQTVDSSNCTTTGVHLIVARASDEKPGEGIIGEVAAEIVYQVPGSDSVAVDYPATLTNYIQSESAGTVAMNQMIVEYMTSCPNSKFALLGYSQGAQVVGDVVCGTSEFGWTVTNALNTSFSNNFIASIQMGDPSYVPNQPQNAGTSKTPGIFNRTNPSGCAPFESRMQAYCDTGDFFCARGVGPDAFPIHLSYVIKYGAAAANYVAQEFNNAVGATNSSTSSTSSSSSSATGSSTSSASASTGTSPPNTTSASVTTTTDSASTSTVTSSSSSSSSTGAVTTTATVTPTPSTSATPTPGGNGSGRTAASRLLIGLVSGVAVLFALL